MNRKKVIALIIILTILSSFFIIYLIKNNQSSENYKKYDLSLFLSQKSKEWNKSKCYFKIAPFYSSFSKQNIKKKQELATLGFDINEDAKELKLSLNYALTINEKATEIFFLFDVIYYLYETNQLNQFEAVSVVYNSGGIDNGAFQYTSIIKQEFVNLVKDKEKEIISTSRKDVVKLLCNKWIRIHNYRKFLRNKGWLNSINGIIETKKPNDFKYNEWLD